MSYYISYSEFDIDHEGRIFKTLEEAKSFADQKYKENDLYGWVEFDDEGFYSVDQSEDFGYITFKETR